MNLEWRLLEPPPLGRTRYMKTSNRLHRLSSISHPLSILIYTSALQTIDSKAPQPILTRLRIPPYQRCQKLGTLFRTIFSDGFARKSHVILLLSRTRKIVFTTLLAAMISKCRCAVFVMSSITLGILEETSHLSLNLLRLRKDVYVLRVTNSITQRTHTSNRPTSATRKTSTKLYITGRPSVIVFVPLTIDISVISSNPRSRKRK